MLRIEGGGWRAALLPERGGALAELGCAGHDVLLPLPIGADPNASWAGAFLMLPWTNRLDEGKLPYPGGLHAFPCNRVEERTALHGLSREHPWQVERSAPGLAVLAHRMAEPGQPYRYLARMEVRLEEGFALTLTVTNEAQGPMPFGTGWHPFFVRPAGTRLRLAATREFRRDERNLPVEAVPSSGVSGGEEAFSGLDTHYAGWDGTARLDLGGLALEMRAGGAWAHNAQVFAPPGAQVICVEPVSHVPDVVNRPRFAALGNMRMLAPGESLRGEVTLRPA